MLVDRRTWVVKRRCMEEALELIKAEGKRVGSPPVWRLYEPKVGGFDLLALEMEYESLEAYEKWWAEYSASPEAAAFQGKLYELTEVGGANELWVLAE